MKKILISIGSVASLGLPVLAFAQNVGSGSYFGTLIRQAGQLLQSILVFLISLAVVWFIYNVIKYSMSGEEDGKEKAKSQMINGIIALAVVVSVWGIVALLRTAFGVEGQNSASSISSDFENMIPGGSSGGNTSGPLPGLGGSGYVSPLYGPGY